MHPIRVHVGLLVEAEAQGKVRSATADPGAIMEHFRIRRVPAILVTDADCSVTAAAGGIHASQMILETLIDEA